MQFSFYIFYFKLVPFHISSLTYRSIFLVKFLLQYVCNLVLNNAIITSEVILMPFDGIVTKAVFEQLQDLLISGRVNKIYQPNQSQLVFTIRSKKQNYSLLFSIHSNYARLHLTEKTVQNPEEPPMFCMLLRKHLQGATINNI